jgi:hypothetical protein
MILSAGVLAAINAFGTGFGLKPGLWESKVVKQVVDGRDTSAQMADAGSKMQQAMANMPAEQRARMEAMMKQHGGPTMGSDGSVKMCISPEEASQDRPVVDRERRCQPATITRAGNRTTFTINCSSNGTVTTGKGESTATGDTISSEVDMTTKKANGETHVLHTETAMRFLGSDCGDVKPMAPAAPSH